jgi:hypothetical protein
MTSNGPDVPQPDGPDERADAADPSAGHWARARSSLRVPGALVRLAWRDPHHVPERLTIYAVDRQADAARAWAQRAQERAPDASAAVLADDQRRRTIGTARIDGAIAGTPFFIALVPAYVAFLQQEVRFHLRAAALYGHDPADPRVAADFLVLRGVHKGQEEAVAELQAVRATPLPAQGPRTPLRSWYEAALRVLVLAGFMSPPEEDGSRLTRRAKLIHALQLAVVGLIWALTWIVPVTFMIVMSWACESDARRFGARVTTRYAQEGDDLAIAMTRADRSAGGSRALTVVRAALVVLSIALPLALIAATVLNRTGPFGVNVPEALGAIIALALVIAVGVGAVRS